MKKFKLLGIIILLFVLHENLLALTEQATFESFYIEDSYVGWIIAGIAAVIGGLVIFFTGGTGSPIVVGVGTWIGEMAGLSGIAASNYGLALLGGGTIASGGLGIAGGVAIITVALSFSTDIVIDYTLGNVISKYSYSTFVNDSKKMPTLPIPQNESGTDSYESTIESLKANINNKETLFSNYNQKILQELIYSINDKRAQDKKLINLYIKEYNKVNSEKNTITSELFINIKENNLLSYLYFVTSQYTLAKSHAIYSIEKARTGKMKRTLPAFIYATSSLYDLKFSFREITQNYFRYSVLAEPDNKLIPLMFAIYLDRVLYRMNDDMQLNYLSLNKIRDIAFQIKDKELRLQSVVVVMMRYFIRIKIEQQKILALTKTSNKLIKNSDKTLKLVRKSYLEYQNLIKSLNIIIENDKIQSYIQTNDKLKDLNTLYVKYQKNEKYLELQISNLEKYQDNKSWYIFYK